MRKASPLRELALEHGTRFLRELFDGAHADEMRAEDLLCRAVRLLAREHALNEADELHAGVPQRTRARRCPEPFAG